MALHGIDTPAVADSAASADSAPEPHNAVVRPLDVGISTTLASGAAVGTPAAKLGTAAAGAGGGGGGLSQTAPAGTAAALAAMPSPKKRGGAGTMEFRKNAYKIFMEMDEDGNNSLDRGELAALSTKLKMHLSKKVLDNAFAKMGGNETTDVDFDSFLGWFSRHKEEARIKNRSKVSAEFKKLSRPGEVPLIEKEDFHRLFVVMRTELDLLPPAFDLDRDWNSMEIIDNGTKTTDGRRGAPFSFLSS